MREIGLLICFCFFIQACVTANRQPSSDGSDGQKGAVGEPGASGKSGGVNADFWYRHTPLQAHYHFAIINGDIKKMQEWILAGFSADTKASPRHPSAIQQAIGYGNLEIVKMLTKIPDRVKRPDLRKRVTVCPGIQDQLEFSLYDFIVYQGAVRDYSVTCKKEDFFEVQKNEDERLYLRGNDFQIFLALLTNENNPVEFEKETSHMLSAFKKSSFSKEKDSPNERIISIIEAKYQR